MKSITRTRVSLDVSAVDGDIGPSPSRRTTNRIALVVILSTFCIDVTAVDHNGAVDTADTFGITCSGIRITVSGIAVNVTAVNGKSTAGAVDTDPIPSCLSGDCTAVDDEGGFIDVNTGISFSAAEVLSFAGSTVAVQLAHRGAGGLCVDRQTAAAAYFDTKGTDTDFNAVLNDQMYVAVNVDKGGYILTPCVGRIICIVAFRDIPLGLALRAQGSLTCKGFIRAACFRRAVRVQIGDPGRRACRNRQNRKHADDHDNSQKNTDRFFCVFYHNLSSIFIF